MAVTASVFWPGIVVFLILLGLSVTGLGYYARYKQYKQSRSLLFWVVGIAICVVAAYIIAAFIITPLLIR